jgi:hypothetical protein
MIALEHPPDARGQAVANTETQANVATLFITEGFKNPSCVHSNSHVQEKRHFHKPKLDHHANPVVIELTCSFATIR